MIEATMLARENASGLVRRELPVGGPVAADADVAVWLASVQASGATVTQAVVDLYDAFAVGLKADGVWNFITDMGVWLGPSTLAGALVKLKGAPALTNNNFVSSDYVSNLGLTGGTGKFLSVNRPSTDFSSDSSRCIVGFHVDSDFHPAALTGLVTCTASGIYSFGLGASFISSQERLSFRAGTSSSAIAFTNSFPGLILATNDGAGVYKGRLNGVEYTPAAGGPTYTGQVALMAYNAGGSAYSGRACGYLLGPFTYGGTEANRAAICDRWATLIAGLKAL